MLNPTFVRGTILVDGSETRLSGADVWLGVRAEHHFHRLQTTITDTNGRFAFDLSANALSIQQQRYEVRVLQDGAHLAITEGTTQWRVGQDPGDLVLSVTVLEGSALVDDPVGEAPEGTSVRGRIRHVDGTAAASVWVRACHLSLTGEVILATDEENPDGNYEVDADGVYVIPYTAAEGGTQLFIRVVTVEEDPEDSEELAVSDVRYNAGDSERIDLEIDDDRLRGISEFATLHASLSGLLSDINVDTLTTHGVGVLSGRSGHSIQKVTRYASARRIARKLEHGGSFTATEIEGIYGLLSAGLSANPGRLAATGPHAIRHALTRMGRQNVISKTVVDAKETVVETLRAALMAWSLHSATPGGLGKLLAITSLSTEQKQAFLELHTTFHGTPKAFWERLAEESLFTEALVAEVRQVFQLSAITLNHPALIQAFIATHGTGDARAAAALVEADWAALIDTVVDGDPIGWPSGIHGDNATEKRSNYLKLLLQRCEQCFPSAHATAGLRRDHSGSSLDTHLAAHPDMDFSRGRISGLEAGLQNQLRKHQRLYRISPVENRYSVMRALDIAGIHSAHQITRLGWRRFVRGFSERLGGVATAREVFSRAQAHVAIAMATYTAMHPALRGNGILGTILPTAYSSEVEEAVRAAIPEYDDLFGGVAFCSCEECRSIHGPAAYYVDLLHWLNIQDPSAPDPEIDGPPVYGDMLNDLFARRPDLETLSLTCENTNRVLPYVDLVLEILENGVPGVSPIAHDSTDMAPEDLAAGAEYVNEAAYDALKVAVFPLSLPFSLHLLQSRAFLRGFGIDRAALMQTLQPAGGLSDRAIVYEMLGLDANSARLILGVTADDPWTLWGFETDAGPWYTTLANVHEFRRRSRINWEEILDLLHSRAINTERNLGVDDTDSDPDAWEFTFGGSDAATRFERIRQFLRLWRPLGWSILELDKVFSAFGWSNLHPTSGVESNDKVLPRLAWIRQIQRHTELSATELASWWGILDTWQDRDTHSTPVLSLYDRVFLDPSRVPTTSIEDSPFLLNTGRTELADTSPTVDAHATEIQAVLGLDAEGYAAALAALSADTDADLNGDDAPILTLNNLSRLYRLASFSRAVHLSVQDALFLMACTGQNPFEDGPSVNGPWIAWKLIDQARKAQEAGWSWDAIRYLLTEDVDARGRIAPTDDWFISTLGRIRDAVRTLKTSLVLLTDDAAGTLCSEYVDLVKQPESDLTAVMTIILGTVDGSSEATLEEALGYYLDMADARIRLIDRDGTGTDGGTLSGADRCSWVLNQILFRLKAGELVQTFLASLLKVDPAILAAFRSEILAFIVAQTPSDPTRQDWATAFAESAFLEDNAPSTPWGDIVLSGSAFLGAYQTTEYLYKLLRLLSTLNFGLEEVTWLLTQNGSGNKLGTLALQSLPVGTLAVAALVDVWGQFANTLDLFALRAKLPGTEPSFASLMRTLTVGAITSDTIAAFTADLASRTAWDASLLSGLADGFGFMTTPTDIQSVYALNCYMDAVAIGRQTGASATDVLLWRTADPGATEADSVLLALRSRYTSAAAWRAMIQPIRDQLREQQRQALVAFHLSIDPSLQDELDLYAKYLIDVEMCPCMQTARLKQATASVQLYVQRIMLGLESGKAFEMDEDLREQWAWMKHFRLWEAARKVFLYPENWLEPELRDDKSELFKQLESVLHQGEITDAKVEDALLGYLDQLRVMGNLQPLAMYHQQEEEEDGEVVDILHVFARTRNAPYTYYYRRFENQSIWTPWEKVGVDVQGNHLIPIVYERRLFLFWAELQQRPGEEDSEQLYYAMTLSWAEHRDGNWSAKFSGDTTVTFSNTYFYDPALLRLQASIDQGVLVVNCLVGYGNTRGSESEYYQVGRFIVDTCVPSVTFQSTGDTTTAWGMTWDGWYAGWKLAEETDSLVLRYATPDAAGELADDSEVSANTLLQEVSSGSTVVVSAQYWDFISQDSFFFSDDSRVFLITPDNAWESTSVISQDITSILSGSFAVAANADLYGIEKPTAPDSGWSMALEKGSLLDKASRQIQLQEASDVLSQTTASFADASAQAGVLAAVDAYQFQTFYHPFLCDFIKEIRRGGVMALLAPSDTATEDANVLARQGLRNTDVLSSYGPGPAVNGTVDESIDFNLKGAYAAYNWEIFFHAPWLIADRLSSNQQFEDADRWYRTILDPSCNNTLIASPQRYWKVRPLMADPGVAVTDWLAFTGSDADGDGQADYEAQVGAWMDDPFNPHLLARLRAGVYQKTIFMKYLDNLVAWGDSLFAQDTMESINEAAQLYVYARQLLGERPQELTPQTRPVAKNFGELFPTLDDFSNAIVTLLDYSPEPQVLGARHQRHRPVLPASAMMAGSTAYFCIPSNKKLLSYWKMVDDRLFKIRHCMNLSGVVRQLALYEPPIDPAMLVRASAMGVDLRTALSGLNMGRPPYRFTVMLQRAQSFTGTLRSFGGALLSALEKKDAEALSVLRSGHEIALLAEMEAVKKRQVAEAESSLVAAQRAVVVTQGRQDHYQRLVDKGLLPQEAAQDENQKIAQQIQNIVSEIQLGGSYVALISQFTSGTQTSLEFGGQQLSKLADFYASAFALNASQFRNAAERNASKAGHQRRMQEWKFQVTSAQKELKQLEKQVLAAEIRVEIAKGELKNHQMQQAQAKNVDAWLQHKYTNADLYQWMEEQLSSVYYQAYKLAFDTAKKAEVCYNYELGRSDSFIQYGYWDSARKGLVAGDLLGHDLDRMDAAYLDNDVREFELVRHVSLAQLDPVALQMLKTGGDGECWFEVPEVLFDADCPGHYFRRIQSVALSLACVAGPQGTVNAQLTLHGHAIRTEAPASGFAALTLEAADFPSIVTSVAVNDAGLFNADPRDPRYLPFERRGAVSRWNLRLTAQTWKQFDWESLTDVTLHLRYTARDGGSIAREAVVDVVASHLSSLSGGSTSSSFAGDGSTGVPVLLSAVRDAPDAWYQVQNATATDMVFTITDKMIPVIDGMSVAGVMVIPIGTTTSAATITASMGDVGGEDDSVMGPTGVLGYYTTTLTSFTPDAEGETLSINLTFTGDDSFATLTDVLLILFLKT